MATNPALQITSTVIFSGLSTSKNDTIVGKGELYGYAGDDFITGSAFNDYINGGDGNDYIVSNGGQDFLIGGLGNDVFELSRNTAVTQVIGGAGQDLYVLATGAGYSVIQDYRLKEDRIDARSCGIGAIRTIAATGALEVVSKFGDTIAFLQGTGYKPTGDLKVDGFNLGIVV